MNINFFFIFLIAGLSAIFIIFQPMEHAKKTKEEVPLLELEKFKLSELNAKGLSSILYGEVGKRYKDRYEVEKLDYTDNVGKQIANLKADDALYKDEKLFLKDNVEYIREDGLTFQAQQANYNKKTNIIIVPVQYVSFLDGNRAIGTYLHHNNNTGITKSTNVTVKYQIKER